MATLTEQRATLTTALYNCDSGAFPGSRAWVKESKALKALADFDAAHPEVLAEVKAAHAASLNLSRVD